MYSVKRVQLSIGLWPNGCRSRNRVQNRIGYGMNDTRILTRVILLVGSFFGSILPP